MKRLWKNPHLYCMWLKYLKLLINILLNFKFKNCIIKLIKMLLILFLIFNFSLVLIWLLSFQLDFVLLQLKTIIFMDFYLTWFWKAELTLLETLLLLDMGSDIQTLKPSKLVHISIFVSIVSDTIHIQGMDRTSDQKENLFSDTNRFIDYHIFNTNFSDILFWKQL